MHSDVRTSLFICSFLTLAQAFYIPGVSYKTYRDGDTIPLLVNKIYSDNSELQYAYTELPFVCPPTGRIKTGRFTSGASISLNLGEVLRGDRIIVSDYELVMGVDEEVRYLCSRELDIDGLRRTQQLIRRGYVAEWIVDNLPGATSFQTTDKSRKYYAAGFKIGEERLIHGEQPQYFLNNHVTIVIRYHSAPGRDGLHGKNVIVGFEVFPKSITASGRNESSIPLDMQSRQDPFLLAPQPNSTGDVDGSEKTTLTVPFTYSVYWREDERVEWRNRWDMYFVAQDDSNNAHWLAIINSLVISGLLTAVVAVILARTIQGDITGLKDGRISLVTARRRLPRKFVSPEKDKDGLSESVDNVEEESNSSPDEDIEDVTGWKLLHGDVFRAPPYGNLFAPLVGSGTQLLFTTVSLLILSAVGVLSPSFRGGYVSVGTGLFVFAGLFSGYFSSRIFRTFGGQFWQHNVLVTASLVPGLLFSTVLILNIFVWVQASSTAIPIGTLIVLVFLWLFIQLPLVYIGGWYGYERSGPWTHPIKANAIPRQIPTRRWLIKSAQMVIMTGLVPFMVISIELTFAFKTLWLDKSEYYYVFGFTTITGVILTITVIEVTIVASYFLLCSENYHWWWHSFLIGGSSSLWVYAYLVYYYYTKLHIVGFVSGFLFFAYGFLVCAVYALLTGTIGFLAAYIFVRRIYGAIKVD
ncbi:putative multispanning membrane protein [Pyrenochaeta sp. MPI-SDFR-AT-0127]|nr:putative multispanning membrane protein [Pyrenochaeta sp. MPI-SDFR-AT-0127]